MAVAPTTAAITTSSNLFRRLDILCLGLKSGFSLVAHKPVTGVMSVKLCLTMTDSTARISSFILERPV